MAITTPISYYKLDESSGNASDSVGSNTGTNNNTVIFSAGKINNGADFNGTNQSFSLGTSSTLNPSTTLSINAWFKTTDNTVFQCVMSRDTVSSIGVDRCYGLYVLSGKLYGEVFSSSTASTITGGTTLANNTWYMVTMVQNGTDLRIYLNGTSDATPVSSAITLFTATINTYIGARGNSTGYMKGSLDEIGLWSTALSSTEVTELYNGGVGKQYPFTSSINNSGFFQLMV
jgi:hypothetical protein